MKLTVREKRILIVSGIIILVFVYLNYFIFPQVEKISGLKYNIGVAKKEVESLNFIKSNFIDGDNPLKEMNIIKPENIIFEILNCLNAANTNVESLERASVEDGFMFNVSIIGNESSILKALSSLSSLSPLSALDNIDRSFIGSQIMNLSLTNFGDNYRCEFILEY